MKHDELVKKLRSGCDANTAFLLCYEAADAIVTLQARVAELERDGNVAAWIVTWMTSDRIRKPDVPGIVKHAAKCYAEEMQRLARAEADLAAARTLLREANEMLAEAIVCGPKLREYMPLRQRIVAALAGEKK